LRPLDEDPEKTPPVADYLGTLLRDPTSSHLLETLVTRSPPTVFSTLFKLYFKGKLARLANHPVANFVVAKVIVRANEEVFTSVVEELRSEFGKLAGM
jgi:nucleolar protein 9